MLKNTNVCTAADMEFKSTETWKPLSVILTLGGCQVLGTPVFYSKSSVFKAGDRLCDETSCGFPPGTCGLDNKRLLPHPSIFTDHKSYCSTVHYRRIISIYQPTNAHIISHKTLLKHFKTLRHVSILSVHHQGALFLAKVILQYVVRRTPSHCSTTQHDMLPQHLVCKYELNCEYCNIILATNKAL